MLLNYRRLIWSSVFFLLLFALNATSTFAITCYPEMPYGMSCLDDETIKDWCGDVKCQGHDPRGTYSYTTNKCQYTDPFGNTIFVNRENLDGYTFCTDSLIGYCSSNTIQGGCEPSRLVQDANSLTGWVCEYGVLESCTYTTQYDPVLGLDIGIPEISCGYSSEDCLATDRFGGLTDSEGNTITLSYATCDASGCHYGNPDYKECCDGSAVSAGSGGAAWCSGGKSVPDGV
jgi:hypothetical protein